MVIEYGPPGAKGVTTIMGVGDDGLPTEQPPLHKVSRAVEIGALATWVYAWRTKNAKLKRQAGGVAMAALVVSLLTRRW